MTKLYKTFLLALLLMTPALASAKGLPLFFQSGDELFEIEGAPVFDDGYKVGYACQRFGLFGADVWTWDCKLMAIDLPNFSAGPLTAEQKTQYESQFSLSDRIRNPWNHYGAIALVLALFGFIAIKAKS